MQYLIVRIVEGNPLDQVEIENLAREDSTEKERAISALFEEQIVEAFQSRAKSTFAHKPVSGLAQIPTKDLLDELAQRPGVSESWVKVAESYAVVVGGGREQSLGPARILVLAE